ncbi:acyl-CoA N-acyltransferase [Aspergillus floccosus]
MAQATKFCFPVKALSSDVVKLTPFEPEKHATAYFQGSKDHPELYKYMSIGPYKTEADFINGFLVDLVGKQSPGMVTFAIIDKTRAPSDADAEGQLAGMVSYMAASPIHLSAEVGYIIILPPFQRTHVTTHAVGLLLQYALNYPNQGGLGLRRIQWLADLPNKASLVAARRMGFEQEGILRWNRVMVDAEARGKGHNGREVPSYGNASDRGRDTVYLSMCWDDWLGGKDKHVERLMLRPIVAKKS